MIDGITAPIRFNPYKHHLNFIKEQILLMKSKEWKDMESLILRIGNNLLDLYLDELSVEEICNECLYYLNETNVLNRKYFLEWLKPLGYKKISLSDKSQWIIKEADDPERFIHIHPAKNSISTIRVRGTTLKTVIAIVILNGTVNDNLLTVNEVNKIRMDYLKLSPIKSIQLGKGISRLWKLFNF